MKHLCLFIILFSLACTAEPKGGIGAGEWLALQGESAIVTETSLPIVVATVKCREHCPGTNAAPPILELQIEKSVRGAFPQKILKARWESSPLDMHGNGSGVTREQKAAWSKQPLAPPPEGSRMILSGPCLEDEMVIHPLGRWAYSVEKEDEVRQWASKSHPLCALEGNWENCNGRYIRLVTHPLDDKVPAYVVPPHTQDLKNACHLVPSEHLYARRRTVGETNPEGNRAMVVYFAPGEFSLATLRKCPRGLQVVGKLEIHHGQGYLPWIRAEALRCGR